MTHRGVCIADIKKCSIDIDRQENGVAWRDFANIEIASMRSGRKRGRCTVVGSDTDATEHGRVRNGELVAPMNLSVFDWTNVNAVRAIAAKPLTKHGKVT